MYGLALFDLDGTLTDPKEGITNSVRHALESFGLQAGTEEELTAFIGPPLLDSFRDLCGFGPEKAWQAVGRYREYFDAKGINENRIYPGIPELLEKLRLSGVRLAVATSKPAVYAERIVRGFGLDGFFEVIAGSELDGTRSRKSDVISFALDSLPPQARLNAVMVGDRMHDMIGAIQTGLDGAGVLWGYGSRRELEEAGAKWIASDPEELAGIILWC